MLNLVGSRVRTIVTMMLVTLMAVGGFISPGNVAAQAQSVQSQLTGVTITYGPPYVLQSDLGYADDVVEVIAFLGAADILSVGFLSPMIDLNSARDILLKGLFGEGVVSANIDRGDYTGVSYSLDMMNLDGDEMGVFSLFINNRSHGYAEFYIFIAPPSLFSGTMQVAQNSFTIGGATLMDGVDATAMGNLVTANVGITGGTAVTDVTEVTDQTNTTETTQTTQTTQTTATDTDARATYLAAVRAEYETANAQLSMVLQTMDAQSNNVMTATQARPVFDASHLTLAGTHGRASAIQPPAGMEAFHQDFLAWAQAMTDMGEGWATTMATGDSTQYLKDFETALLVHTSFGQTLEAERSASGTTQAPEQPAQPTQVAQTTQTTQTTATDTDARATYLAAVRAEYETGNADLSSILETLDALSKETLTTADARPILDASHGNLAGTNNRIAATQPPTGMEAFHQEFVAWSQTMTDLGEGWVDAMASGDSSAYGPLFDAALQAHTSFGDSLESELSAAGSQTGQTTTADASTGTTATETAVATEASGTTRTTRTTQSTTTGTTGTTDADRDEYLQAVRAEYDLIAGQVDIILDTLDALNNQTITAEVAMNQLTSANNELLASEQRTQGLVPPAGMEAFHSGFLDWQASVVATGNIWTQFTSQQVEVVVYIDSLDVLLGLMVDFGISLATEESSSGEATTTLTAETPEATEAATEAAGTTRTTRTTRAAASETAEATEASGATRTTRSTRPAADTTQGNSSETSGNTAALNAGGESWLMPENDVTVTWGEPFLLIEGDPAAQNSDAQTATDILTLVWDAGTEGPTNVNIQVSPTAGDATSFVATLANDEAAIVELFGPTAVAVDSVLDPEASAILIHFTDADTDWLVYMQSTCVTADCSSAALLIVGSSEGDLPVLLADMEQSVAIDGQSISSAIPVTDIQDAVDTVGN